VLGPGAHERHRGHPIARRKTPHAGAHLLDPPHEIVTGHERKRGLTRVAPAPHLHLREGHAGRLEAHEQLARSGRANLALAHDQSLRLHSTRQNHFNAFHD
jgi:hypothetical protein